MGEILEKLARLLTVIKEMRIGILILLFLMSCVYVFNKPISSALSRWLNRKPVVNSIETGGMIYELLEDLGKTVGADRVYVVQFYNGTTTHSGIHMSKFSATYEWTGPGITSMANVIKDKPVGLYINSLKVVMEGKYRYPDVNLIPYPNIRLNNIKAGTKSVASFPYMKHGDLEAVIVIEFVKEGIIKEEVLRGLNMKTWESDSIWNKIRLRTDEIGNLL